MNDRIFVNVTSGGFSAEVTANTPPQLKKAIGGAAYSLMGVVPAGSHESRIRILTVLSSICMLLTLIAGIYGMNFSRMPELQTSWGYPATLGTMVLIAIGQLWLFHKRDWFG